MKKLLALFVFLCGFMFFGGNVQAATFYRGLEVASTIAPDEMGFVPTNALLISGKKRTIKTDFFNLVTDLGGIRQQFAPRDPVNKNIVYFGTNHSIRAEGGQTGVFIVWKYNIDNGSYSRLYSLRYDPETKPVGYDIVGNEGTKLVILENIDGPHCPRDIPTEFPRLLRALDMRTPAKGLSAYTPSVGMKAVFSSLPRCFETQQEPTLSLTATHSTVTAGEAVNIGLQARFSATQLPTGSRLEIQEIFAGHSGTLIRRCEGVLCVGTLRGEALTQGIHIYVAYILNASGQLLYQSETVRVDVQGARQGGDPLPNMYTSAAVVSHSRTVTSMVVEGRLYSAQNLNGTRIELYRHSTGTVPGLDTSSQNILIKTCTETDVCRMTDETNTVYASVRYSAVFIRPDGQRVASPLAVPFMGM